MKSRAALLIAACSPIVLGACGGGGDELATFEHDAISVSYPRGWRPIDTSGDQGVVLAVSEPGPHGTSTRLVVYDQPAAHMSAQKLGESLAESTPGLAGADRSVDGPTSVDGAAAAWKVSFDYALRGDDGTDVPARAVEIATMKDGRQYIVTLAGPRDRMADEQVKVILESLRIG